MRINRSVRILLACFALVIAQQATAQQSAAELMSSDLIAAGASVTKLSGGFVFTEGASCRRGRKCLLL